MSTLLEERPATRAAPEVVVRVETTSPGRGGGGRRGGRGFFATLGLGAVAVAVVLVLAGIAGLISIGNPFGTTTTDQSPPVLLKRLKNLSVFEAAQAQFQSRVEIKDDVAILPDFIAGSTVDFDAFGSVAATVDFSKLGTDAVRVNTDRSVTIKLPRPTLQPAVVDPKRSHVVNRDLGLVNHIGNMFKDNPTSERELYLRAAKKMDKAARVTHVVARAEVNTTKMLRSLLARLGFPKVHVLFTSGNARVAQGGAAVE